MRRAASSSTTIPLCPSLAGIPPPHFTLPSLLRLATRPRPLPSCASPTTPTASVGVATLHLHPHLLPVGAATIPSPTAADAALPAASPPSAARLSAALQPSPSASVDAAAAAATAAATAHGSGATRVQRHRPPRMVLMASPPADDFFLSPSLWAGGPAKGREGGDATLTTMTAVTTASGG
eukprot:TRINITY_DN1091_c1_g1_i1.p2 TRINITY_DN1091_c1_g1~~TRINITY_DN1091_c1_g1_i1.p2  ORF type:complete len:180 (-),score=37.47 TRINITY_DN1091_c1_g1_i1:28-567(-)